MLKPLRVVFGVLLSVLFVGPVFAQSVDTAWVRRYNGPDNGTDANCRLVLDATGNVYVAGSSWGTAGDFDFAMVKYSSSGNEEWVRRYNGPGNDTDFVYALAVDKFGDVYVTGASEGSGTDWDFATIKYHPNGDTAWVRRYNGPENDEDFARAVTVDTSGNACVTGASFTPGGQRYVTIKYNPSGDTVWLRRYGDYDSDAMAIASDDPGNFYVTGRSAQQQGSFKNFDFATIKYLPNGDTAWVRRYNGTGDSTDVARAITVDGSGNLYVTGSSDGTGTGSDYVTIRYYPSGDTAWVRRYDGPANGADIATAIGVDASNNVYVTGYSDSTGSSQDYATIKYDSSGNELWVKRFNCANGTDKPYAIAVDDSNSIYVTGMSGCGGVTGFDYVTIKYYSNGDTAWLRKYHGPVESGADKAYALAVDTSGNVYVTGASQGSGTDYDYCTIKYTQTPNTVEDETGDRERPSEFDLSQNYPNPFNPTTKIEFTLAKSGFVTLQIYDVLGRKVRTLVSEDVPSGYKSVIWDGKNEAGKEVASGVYFYQLKVGDFSEPKKMLLLK